jgi:nicotinamidase-related amidase
MSLAVVMVVVLPADGDGPQQRSTTGAGDAPKSLRLPSDSFLKDCAFVCVDIQPGTRLKRMPKKWREWGFSKADVDAATDYTYDVAHPNARRVADACRQLRLPMVFTHWGYQFKDGMDLDPNIRDGLCEEFGLAYDKWPHHISAPDSMPAEILGVHEGEYVIAKTAQDAFRSSSIGHVLRNLRVRNLVFVGGHTGACLHKTATSAKRRGFKTLCVQDATFDARQSTRLHHIKATDYDYVVSTEEFLDLVSSVAGR